MTTSPKAVRLDQVIMILLFMILVAARLPNAALHGRVWAEEGLFFGNAAKLPWLIAIVHSEGGYLNIVANLSGMVAFYLVPLEDFRWVGVVTGLLFQVIPAVLVIKGRFDFVRTRFQQVVALLLLVTVPVPAEAWLNSLHPQFHLTVCAALILAMDDPRSRWGRWSCNFLIALGALCGPTTWFLLPLFVGRAMVDRSWPRAEQAGILSVGVILQLTLWLHNTPNTSFHLAAVVYVVFVRFLLPTWLDYETVDTVTRNWFPLTEMSLFVAGLAFAEVAIAALVGAFLWSRRKALFWMFAAAVIVAVPTIVAARGGTLAMLSVFNGPRYALVPQTLIGLVLLGVAVTETRWTGWCARVGVTWLLAIGIFQFHNRKVTETFDSAPSWILEVAAWRNDPKHVLQIAPAGWNVNLRRLGLGAR